MEPRYLRVSLCCLPDKLWDSTERLSHLSTMILYFFEFISIMFVRNNFRTYSGYRKFTNKRLCVRRKTVKCWKPSISDLPELKLTFSTYPPRRRLDWTVLECNPKLLHSDLRTELHSDLEIKLHFNIQTKLHFNIPINLHFHLRLEIPLHQSKNQ